MSNKLDLSPGDPLFNAADEIERLERELAAVTGREDALVAEIEALRKDATETEAHNAAMRGALAEVKKSRSAFQRLLAESEAQCAALSAVPREPEGWRLVPVGLLNFALAVLRESREQLGTDIDGGWLQDTATDLGVLVEVPVKEPCGEDCRCAEYGFPTECYRYSEDVRRLLSAEINGGKS